MPRRKFDHDEARRLYTAEHLSFSEIGRRLGVGSEAVRQACYAQTTRVVFGRTQVIKPRKQVKPPPTDHQLLQRFARLTVGEPAVREDGRCVVCSKPRRPERSQTYAKGCAQVDPFCSSDCARIYHGNPLPERPTHPGRPSTIALCGTMTAYKQGCRCDACRNALRVAKAESRARAAISRERMKEGAAA